MWESSKKQDEINKRTIVWIFLLGFLIRLCAALNTYVVNPDGTIYIYQAKALFYAQWDQLTSCGIDYLGVRYYVWEERNWPQNSFDFLRSIDKKDLTEISEGYHPSTGKMVLFKVL